MFKDLLIDLIKTTLLTLGVSFMSLGIHTSELQYSVIGGICLGFYELIKND
jgi:hypothetical protein